MIITTTVTGTLLKNSLIKPYAGVSAIPNPKILRPRQLPEPTALESTLESIFPKNRAEAKRFYRSLNSNDQGNIRDLILTEKGKLDLQENFFFIPANSTPERTKFLEWFINRFTTYIPKEEKN